MTNRISVINYFLKKSNSSIDFQSVIVVDLQFQKKKVTNRNPVDNFNIWSVAYFSKLI